MVFAIGYFLLIVLGVVVVGWTLSHYSGWTEPFIGKDGLELLGSVSSVELIRLGGVKQAVLIRGKSTKNPLLIYLHGGPGEPEMHLLRHYNPKLEEAFIVANWDQRPSGKSFTPFAAGSLTMEGLVSEAGELMEILCRRYGKKKAFILAHSWGSLLGAALAEKIPDRIAAYIGMGQLVDVRQGEEISRRFALSMAKENNDVKVLKVLEKTGAHSGTGPRSIRDMRRQRRILLRYGGVLHGEKSGKKLSRAFFGHEYNVFDLMGYLIGRNLSMRRLWPELIEARLTDGVKLDAPVYLFTGRYDYCAPFELAEKYLDALIAPRKEIVWFENSANFPNVEEPEKFIQTMIEVRDRHA
jgi:pimeloyl-ACP methyl ester carboxylesterase